MKDYNAGFVVAPDPVSYQRCVGKSANSSTGISSRTACNRSRVGGSWRLWARLSAASRPSLVATNMWAIDCHGSSNLRMNW